MPADAIRIEGARVSRGGRSILAIDDLAIADGAITAIVGQNGSGKSTLMNLLARQSVPDEGRVLIDGAPLAGLSQKRLARRLAYLPQRLPAVAGLNVRELALLGRYAWRGAFGRMRAEDIAIVDTAMQRTGMTHRAGMLVDRLSGGERQRAWIAMLLAQESPLLMLDEPTSALDLAHQYATMRLLRALNIDQGKGVVVVLHDVNLAARFADNAIALQDGRIAWQGPARDLLAAPLLTRLFGIDIDIIAHPSRGAAVAVIG